LVPSFLLFSHTSLAQFNVTVTVNLVHAKGAPFEGAGGTIHGLQLQLFPVLYDLEELVAEPGF